MEDNYKIRVGITHGDINGVGYEVILKTFFKSLNFLCDFEGSLSPSLECLTIIPLFLTPVNPFRQSF